MRRAVVTLVAVSCLAPLLAAQDATIAAALKKVSAQRIESDIRKLVSFGTRQTFSADEPDRGAPAAARWIRSEFEKAAKASEGRMTVEMQPFDPRQFRSAYNAIATRLLKGRPVHNVIAKLKGSDPKRGVIIVSGHYDSMPSRGGDATSDAPGANDDASGTAVALELARVCADMKPAASVWFVAVTGEEQGLWGSKYLAKTCDESGIEVEAMFTNDIVGGAKDKNGWSDPHTVRVFSPGPPTLREDSHPRLRRIARQCGESDSPSRQLARYIESTAKTYCDDINVRLVFRLDRFLRGGDHRPFTLMGWAAVRYTEPKENYTRQHQNVRTEDGIQYGDLPDFLDFPYIARVARVNAAAALSLAFAPPPLTNVGIHARRLMNETRLSWDPWNNEALAHYEVLMRRTHEYTWTKTVPVGKKTDVTLPESKDDFVFAVRAVAKSGHEGLPVFQSVARRRRR